MVITDLNIVAIFYVIRVILIKSLFAVFLLVIIFTFVLWHYWQKFKPYGKFHNYFVCDWTLVRMAILQPRNISRSVFHFQKIVNICQKFEDEGFFSMLLPWPALYVYGEKAVKFFSNEPSVSNKPARFYKFFDLINNNSLFRSNGKRMKKQRKLIGPAFYPKILKDMVTVMNEHAAYLTKELKQLRDYTANDLGKIMEYRTLMLFFETSLGIKPEAADIDGRMMKFLHLMSEYTDYVIYRVLNPWLYFDFMLKFSQEGRKHMKRKDELKLILKEVAVSLLEAYLYRYTDYVIYRVLNPWLYFDFMLKFSQEGKKHMKRKEELKLILKEIADDLINSDNSRTASINLKDINQLRHPHQKSFGKILIEEHVGDPSFTLEDLKMELITLILAGYDTVSQALTWTLWLLGQNEGVQEKAYEEIKSIDADVINYDDAHNFKYLECIIKESLRLYPVAPLFGRYSYKDIQFGKYTIYRGTPIIFFPYVLHRNPELYPNPEIFNPDRFSESNCTAKPWTNIPFAEGVRSCIGKNYAMLVMKIFLAHVIRDFRLLSLTQKEDFEVTWNMMLRSSKPLSMKFIPR